MVFFYVYVDMREQYVFDPLASKRSQLYLATQLVKMVLKIDDVFFRLILGY